MVRYFFLAFIPFVLIITPTQAQQDKEYFFQKLTTVNGLSSNDIQYIFRDSRGYVWISTHFGLNRYDGRNIKVYHHDPNNPHSLPSEDVRMIKEDKDGSLWIGADYGLIEFNPVTEQFCYYVHDVNKPGSLVSDHIPVPIVDSGNNLWVGTEKGLQIFDRNHHSFKTIYGSMTDSLNKNTAPVFGWPLLQDKNNNFWFASFNEGLMRFNPVKGEYKFFPVPNKMNYEITDMLIDHEGTFWVVLNRRGLNLFRPETGHFEPIPTIKITRYLVFGNISEWKDPAGLYWLTICTSEGLLFYHYPSGNNFLVRYSPANSCSLLDKIPSFVYTDTEGVLWIGTQKGLNILDNADQAFHSRSIMQGISPEDRRIPGGIETIYEDKDVKMLSFGWSKGLGIYDKEWKLIRFYHGIPPSDTSMEAMNIFGIWKDFRRYYWITTDNCLTRFDVEKNMFKIFIPPYDDNKAVNGLKLLRDIIPFDSTSFYVRCKTYGLLKFDFIKGEFLQDMIHNDNDPSSLPTNYIRAVLKDDENRLILVSVNEGIFIYDPSKGTFQTFNHDPDPSVNEAINNLYFDPFLSGKILWLNTAHGLLKFDMATNKFELFNSRNGLASEFLLSNEVDDSGNVWVAHNAGISRFNPVSRTFTNYSENNGLVFKEFNHNMRKMADGNIYISDQDRLICFNPAQFKSNQNIPQVHINSVQVENEQHKITIDSIARKKILTLPHDQALITVDFSVLNLSHPYENKFFFRLDDDSVWHKVNEGVVNLFRLTPGHYVLHVTGSNDCGVMNPTGDSLFIRILPPYYQTWWFRFLLVLGVVLLILLIRRRGIKRIRQEERLKTEFNKKLAQAETKALRAQMNPHFIFNSLNSINSFVIEQKHEIASEYLIKFSKLIRLILDNSRNETISIDKELETLKLYVFLESARFDNKFRCNYQIADDVNTSTVMIPPMLLQPFVENAIWHGLMQKEGEGTITVEIKKQDEEFLNISITDDGIGREKAAELKSKSATHKSHGLKVTSQRIEMMNKINSTGAKVNIVDVKDERGNASGTKVELIIPF